LDGIRKTSSDLWLKALTSSPASKTRLRNKFYPPIDNGQ